MSTNVKKLAAKYEALIQVKGNVSKQSTTVDTLNDKTDDKFIDISIIDKKEMNNDITDDIDLKIVNTMLTDIINDIVKINRK
jgi:hypothetical protein